MKKYLLTKYFYVFIIGVLTFIFCPQSAYSDNLTGYYNFGSDTTYAAAFGTVTGTTFTVPANATGTLAIATFSTTPAGADDEVGTYRIYETSTTATSGNISRYIVDSTHGIGSVVYAFSTAGAGAGVPGVTNATFQLQHSRGTTAPITDITTSGSLVVIPLETNTGSNLAWSVKQIASANTSGTTYSDVFGPPYMTIDTVTPGYTQNGSFYVAASVETIRGSGGGTDVGYWKMQYSSDGGANWNDLGYQVQRSISNDSESGIVNLVAHLPGQQPTTNYQFRLQHKDSGTTLTTQNTNFVAVFTGYKNGSNFNFFPTFSTHNAAVQTKTSISTATSGGLTEAISLNFDPRVNTDLFLHAQYWMESTGSVESVYDLFGDNSIFDGLNQQRSVSSTGRGSGASVGLATGLTTGTTYNLSLRHSKIDNTAQRLTSFDPYLIILDLNSFYEGTAASCPKFPPQTPTRTPGPDNCLYYDGVDNYVSVPDDASLDLTSPFTIECWIKPDSLGAIHWIMGKGGITGSQPSIQLNASNHVAVYWNSVLQLTGATALPSTCQWYHIAVTYDGTLRLYINGIEDTPSPAPTPAAPAANGSALTIGQGGDAVNYYNGAIDEVKIWKYAFGTTILRDWMCKKATYGDDGHPNWNSTTNNLSAYYRFDENGLDSTVHDEISYLFATYNNGTCSAGFAFATDRICSSAPIGDESDHDYTGTTTSGTFNVALSYPPEYQFSTVNDEMTVTNDGGTWTGLQLYRVDEGPNNNVPPFAWGTGYTLDPLRYWGVFADNVFSTSPTYQMVYDWTLHQGLTKESWNSLDLAKRDGNCGKPWASLGSTLDTITRTLTKSNQTGTEYILGGNINSRDPLTLTLIYFTATASESRDVITVKWATATEINTVGFHLWRSESKNGVYTQITNFLIPAEGGDLWGATYEYDDYDVMDEKEYYYKLQEIEEDQTQQFYGPVDQTISIIGNKTVDSKSGGTCFISTLCN